ncbi:MAG: M48 family peptidase, partial [Burkholderiales bacterium]|nr:M48 family peptidase [Burkholderiales bacterium]
MSDHRFFRPKFRLMVCAAISTALIVSPLSLFAQTLPSLPDLGDVSQKLLTPSQERKIGEGIMTQMRADGVYMNDPEVNDYLDLLGHRLVAADKDTRQPFDF